MNHWSTPPIKKRRETPDGFKWCADCDCFVPVHMFSKSQANWTGLYAYCKSHASKRHQADYRKRVGK